MLVFSALGLTLKVVQPDLLAQFKAAVDSTLESEIELARQINDVIDKSLDNWALIGVLGVLIALWTGSAWMGALKRAVRVQLRPLLGKPEGKLPLPLDILANLGILIVLVVGVLITFLAMWLTLSLGAQIGFPKTISVLTSVVAGTLLFWLMLRIFAVDPPPRVALWEGSILGAAGLGVLQLVATELVTLLSHNLTVIGFGAAFAWIFILMLFMNLFASLILLVAAWVGTWEDRATSKSANEDTDEVPILESAEKAEDHVLVEVAEKSMGIGMASGYALGAATGVGLGALLAWLASRRSK
jgi:membrane protein